jgi:formate hydrogenlyase subunit 3/multisubunit Na+/H+ antiporter MnhD subunit
MRAIIIFVACAGLAITLTFWGVWMLIFAIKENYPPTHVLVKWLICPVTGFSAIVLSAITRIDELFRGHLRARRGCCSSCNYELKGNVSGTCPECGMTLSATRINS